jgi:hypothetical protein
MHLLLQRINHPRTFQQHHRHIWNTGGRRNRLPNERKPRSFVNQQHYPEHTHHIHRRPVVDRHKQRIHNHIRLRHKFNRVQLQQVRRRNIHRWKSVDAGGIRVGTGDISSGTFLSITNTNGVGIGIVGGSDPEHIDEPFSTTGLFINKELKNTPPPPCWSQQTIIYPSKPQSWGRRIRTTESR